MRTECEKAAGEYRGGLQSVDEIILRRCLSEFSGEDIQWIINQLDEYLDCEELENASRAWEFPERDLFVGSEIGRSIRESLFSLTVATRVRFGETDRLGWDSNQVTATYGVVWEWDDVECSDVTARDFPQDSERFFPD